MRYCGEPGCVLPAEFMLRFCHRHLDRHIPISGEVSMSLCHVVGCMGSADENGYCRIHRNIVAKENNMVTPPARMPRTPSWTDEDERIYQEATRRRDAVMTQRHLDLCAAVEKTHLVNELAAAGVLTYSGQAPRAPVAKLPSLMEVTSLLANGLKVAAPEIREALLPYDTGVHNEVAKWEPGKL